jgi:glutathione peroxidase
MAEFNADSAHAFTFNTLKGQPLPLSQFAGRPVVIVNTASKCGFTPQYAGLVALSKAYQAQGLVVLGAPSNDFGRQEPGSASEIQEFCDLRYGVDFPLTEKVHVIGPQAHPLFRWIADKGGFIARPHWNFYKYLIGRDGSLVDWFSSVTAPGSKRFITAIERLVK